MRRNVYAIIERAGERSAATRRGAAWRAPVLLAAAILLASNAPHVSDAAGASEANEPAGVGRVSSMPGVANEAEARRALEAAFQMLRAGDYGGLYDALPSASRRRVTRARFVESLNRARGMYELERMEVSNVSAVGDLAAADTVIYGRALRPITADGKIVARQYLLREGGRWRVTTSDRQTVGPLLAAHPDFARRYPPREPRVFIRRDGKWVDISTLARSRRR